MATRDQGSFDELLSAYLDGEVTPDERMHIERILEHDEQAQRRLKELRSAVDAVASLPRHSAPPAVAEDVLLHVERSELLGGTATPSSSFAGRRLFVPAAISMAAVLGLAVGITWVMFGQASGPAPLFDRVDSPSSGAVAVKSRAIAEDDAEGRGRASEAVSETPSTLLAMANYEQKIEAGLGLESVKGHAFANEPLRLQVPVRTATEGEAVTDKLVAMLSEQQAVNLGQYLEGEADDGSPRGAFYYLGRPNVNFAESGQQQILVRARKEDLLNVLDGLVQVTPEPQGVAFQVGPIAVHGVGQVQSAIGGFGKVATKDASDDRKREQAKERSTPWLAEAETNERPMDPGEDFGAAMDRFISLLQIDPDVFKGLTRSTGEPAELPAAAPGERLAAGSDAAAEQAGESAQTQAPDAEVKKPLRLAEAEEGGEVSTPAATTGKKREHIAVSLGREHGDERAERTKGAPTTVMDGGTGRSVGTKEKTVPPIQEPPSLVGRRLGELKREARRAGITSADKSDRAAAVSVLQPMDQPLDPFVTLVIQLIPTQPEPAAEPKPTQPAGTRSRPTTHPPRTQSGVQ